MYCKSCVFRIEFTLGDWEGLISAKVDLATKLLAVVVDDQVFDTPWSWSPLDLCLTLLKTAPDPGTPEGNNPVTDQPL